MVQQCIQVHEQEVVHIIKMTISCCMVLYIKVSSMNMSWWLIVRIEVYIKEQKWGITKTGISNYLIVGHKKIRSVATLKKNCGISKHTGL